MEAAATSEAGRTSHQPKNSSRGREENAAVAVGPDTSKLGDEGKVNVSSCGSSGLAKLPRQFGTERRNARS